jgi:peptidoglycan biosynthesis protein MviN/MurJ (putative lipid II flippase)
MGQSLGIGGINTASMLVKILLAGYFLNMSTGAASAIASGIGRTEFERRLGVFLLIATPCLLVIFIKVFGFYGIPMATSLSLSLGSLYYMVTFCHALGKRVGQFWSLFLKPSLSIAAALVLMKSFQLLVFRTDELSRIEGVLSLGILFIVSCGSYIGALLVLRTFDDYDIVIAKALFGKLRAYN